MSDIGLMEEELNEALLSKIRQFMSGLSNRNKYKFRIRIRATMLAFQLEKEAAQREGSKDNRP